MKSYKLSIEPNVAKALSIYAIELEDGIPTGAFVNTETNQAYLAWVAEGNTPEPAEENT
jgi:hypothetical protein